MDKLCRECNHKNKPRARKCSSCGASLISKKRTKADDSSSISSMATVIDKKAGKKSRKEILKQDVELRRGDIIAERYELLEKIGEGGIGQVWKANDRKLDRQVALKKLHFKFSSSVEAYNRFIREAKVLSKLNNPNICNIYDLVEDKDTSYISMEYPRVNHSRKLSRKKA